MSLVSLIKFDEKNMSLQDCIEQSLKLINYTFDSKIKKIAIKPNMCYYYHPSTGEVTDPNFVAALIDVFRANFAETSEIMIVESDATAMKCSHAFKMLEYDKMAETKGVKLINLAEEKSRTIETNLAGFKFFFQIPELFYEADLIVNVPKPKYMGSIKLTCALKNFYGCNAFPKKSVYHKALAEAIVFINKQIRTDLVVVDGVVVTGRSTKKLNMVMSSENIVATDAAVSNLLGLAPRSVKQIRIAQKEGLGDPDFTPLGDFSYFRKNFPRRVFKDGLRQKAASAYFRVFQ